MEFFDEIIELGSDIECKNQKGRTPLHILVINHNYELVDMLLSSVMIFPLIFLIFFQPQKYEPPILPASIASSAAFHLEILSSLNVRVVAPDTVISSSVKYP